MNLSPDQLKKFWQLWPQACRANGWTREAGLTTAEIDAKRKEFLASCGFESLTTVDRTTGFTKVKNGLLVLIGASLQSGLEVGDPTLNKARNYRHVIMNDLTPCLALYVEDVAGYITAIMEDKNRWWKIDRPACEITLEDLDAKPIVRRLKNADGKWEPKEFPSQLEQLVMTLAARLNVLRNKSDESIHTMKTRAGVPCGCKQCSRQAVLASLPALPAGTDTVAQSAEMMKDTDGKNPF